MSHTPNCDFCVFYPCEISHTHIVGRIKNEQQHAGCMSIRDVIVRSKWRQHVASHRMHGFWKAFSWLFQYKMRYLVVSKKRIHYSCEGGIKNPFHAITDCHHSTSLVMPIDEPPNRFFCPTLTLMMDSYRHKGYRFAQCWQTVIAMDEIFLPAHK